MRDHVILDSDSCSYIDGLRNQTQEYLHYCKAPIRNFKQTTRLLFPLALSRLICICDSFATMVCCLQRNCKLASSNANKTLQLGQLLGLVMLLVATTVFLYYTAWTLLMVCVNRIFTGNMETDVLSSPLSTLDILSTTYSHHEFGRLESLLF